MRKSSSIDNSTYAQKVMLRQTALAQLADVPVVMETHGGVGDVWSAVYAHIETGVVFEKDPFRTPLLAQQRPSWSVYEADSAVALGNSAGSHLTINLLDVDPFGDPWPTLAAYFSSQRPFADHMVVVVNDGLRVAAAGSAWKSDTLSPMVSKYGNQLWPHYLDICQELMSDVAIGYTLRAFEGYYCGDKQKMTHYLAVLAR